MTSIIEDGSEGLDKERMRLEADQKQSKNGLSGKYIISSKDKVIYICDL
jgi:hypothetical protein